MPIINVTCPTCATKLELDAQYANQDVQCGSCQNIFQARTDDSPAAPADRPSRRRREAEEDDERPARRSRRRNDDDDDDERPRRRNDDDDDDERPRRRRRRNDDYDDDYDRPRGAPRKQRLAYILLGLFLGKLGIHNFYAGRTGPAIAQLLITLISIPLMCIYIGIITIFIPYIWAIIDICTIDRDGDGRRME